MKQSTPRVAVFGRGQQQIHAAFLGNAARSSDSAIRALISFSSGGEPFDVARHLQMLGTPTGGVLLTGPAMATPVMSELQATLPGVYQLSALERAQTRVSLQNGHSYVETPKSRIDQLPENYRHVFSTAPFSFVGPMRPEDNPLLLDVMMKANRPVVLASAEQLQDSGFWNDIVRNAYCLVCSSRDLESVTGERNRYQQISKLRANGCRKAVVCSRHSVLGYSNGSFHFERAFLVDSVRRHGGELAAFTAGLLAGLANGFEFRSAMTHGLALLADHIENASQAMSLIDLDRRASGRERQPVVMPANVTPLIRPALKWAATISGLLMMPALWLMY